MESISNQEELIKKVKALFILELKPFQQRFDSYTEALKYNCMQESQLLELCETQQNLKKSKLQN